ncbi:hypothetical protein [Streptomyces laurentii]|uniref:hypothetical protein n=1 Tax=Streptomyces laurentii TaxID=39478 RepID=UPI0033CA1976
MTTTATTTPTTGLATDHGLRRHPAPAPGCTVCALLIEWFGHYAGTGPRHDASAAVDCAVEIRNHPHNPPKMTLKRHAPPPPR